MSGLGSSPFSLSLSLFPSLAQADSGAGSAFSFPGAIPAAILLAYVIGATPFGFLAGRMRGIDIRDHGSGNIGATNVLRVLGKPIGITVFILDVLKGLLPVMMVQKLAGQDHSLAPILAAIATILGHNYTFWLGFKGGKGIATSAGALLPLMPIPLGIAVLAWFLVFGTTRYVSIASILAAGSLPVTVAVSSARSGKWDWPLLSFAAFLGVMAAWRHRSNIRRLKDGTEHKFLPGKKRSKGEGHPPLDGHSSPAKNPGEEVDELQPPS